MGCREAKVKRIAVVKFRVYKRGSNSRGSGIVQSGTNTAKITNVKETASGDRGNLFREGQVAIKDETKVACRRRRKDGSSRTGRESGVRDFSKLFRETNDEEFSFRWIESEKVGIHPIGNGFEDVL